MSLVCMIEVTNRLPFIDTKLNCMISTAYGYFVDWFDLNGNELFFCK